MVEEVQGIVGLTHVALEKMDFLEVLGVEDQLVVQLQQQSAAQPDLVQHVKEQLVVLEFKYLIHVHTEAVEAELVVLLQQKMVVLEKLLL